ncbi:collagen-like protein [uncultured Psychrobacillus sp.]|uniref:BclA C-terminal domain-containing protein n=1 Tax=uncultured Psychrobacillus sp. TaxID=1551585 RepID=UPI00262B7358|nr:collagen-like protein [uncultured Psychrobacillus sp.]
MATQPGALGADVAFDTNGLLTSGITHTAGEEGITVTTPGDYEITFFTTTNEPSQFELFVNDTAIPGTLYGSGSGVVQNNGFVIVTLAAGDVITLRNSSSTPGTVTLTPTGGTGTNVNASITIKKLDS